MNDQHSHFASPGRSSETEILNAQKQIIRRELFVKALSAFPKIVLVLDQNRQIAYCNEQLCLYLGMKMPQVLGKRPGELFGCIHSDAEPFGCGTSLFCRECGAVKSILLAQKGEANSQECRMTVRSNGLEKSLDLRVWSVPFETEDGHFVVFTIDDVASEKRRETLERTFFHDVLNEAAVLIGYLDNIVDGYMPMDKQTTEEMRKFARSVVNTIQSQRDLLAAEEDNLQISANNFSVQDFLKELVDGYTLSKEGRSRRIALENEERETFIHTDRVILGRVIGNLIKNALEASVIGGVVTVRHRIDNGRHCFSVHNQSVMPDEVRLQIFQRSFSTKGKGRGIGTYSAKYFTEHFLKGEVSFRSQEGEGTTFYVKLN